MKNKGHMKRAQVTIEYLLFVGMITMVLTVLIGQRDSKMRRGVEDVVNGSTDKVVNLINGQIRVMP